MSKLIYRKEAIWAEPRILDVDVDLSPVMDLERDTAFISGSVVEGFGNSASDVDIYVITDKNPLLPNGIKIGYTNSERGYYSEVIVLHYDYLYELCVLINEGHYDIFAPNFLEQMEHYYRCATGIPLLNEEVFHEASKGFSKQKAIEAYADYYKAKCIENIQIISSLLEQKRTKQSYEYARSAVQHAIDYWLAINGEGYESSKFRFLKIERLCSRDSEMYKKCWQLQFKGDSNYDDYGREVINLCQELGSSSQSDSIVDIKYSLTKKVSNVELLDKCFIYTDSAVYKTTSIHIFVIKQLKNNIALSKTDLITRYYDSESTKNSSRISNLLESSLDDLLKNGIIKIH